MKKSNKTKTLRFSCNDLWKQAYKLAMKAKILPFSLLGIFYALGIVILFGTYTASHAQSNVPHGKPSIIQQKTAPKEIKVPILMYHYIRTVANPKDKLGLDLSVTPEKFDEQMARLYAMGYSSVNLDDLTNAWEGKITLPSKSFILTFDDGYTDFYTNALPILEKYNFQATAYIVPKFLDKANYLTTNQLKELAGNSLITIGSHTMNHYDLRNVSRKNLMYEIAQSKNALEYITGKPMHHFSYPSGKFNNAVIREVEKAKYKTATTTLTGTKQSQKNAFVMTRVRIPGAISLEQFLVRINQ